MPRTVPADRVDRGCKGGADDQSWAVREYVNGSLWVWPGVSAIAALLIGFVVSRINVSPGSPWAPLAFQGTADDARALLTIITGTVVTVIALVLGLTVVALCRRRSSRQPTAGCAAILDPSGGDDPSSRTWQNGAAAMQRPTAEADAGRVGR